LIHPDIVSEWFSAYVPLNVAASPTGVSRLHRPVDESVVNALLEIVGVDRTSGSAPLISIENEPDQVQLHASDVLVTLRPPVGIVTVSTTDDPVSVNLTVNADVCVSVNEPSPPVETQPVNVKPPTGTVPVPSEFNEDMSDDDEHVSVVPLLDILHRKLVDIPVTAPVGETVSADAIEADAAIAATTMAHSNAARRMRFLIIPPSSRDGDRVGQDVRPGERHG